VSALLEPQTGDHVVQFYEDEAALAAGVGGYMGDDRAARIMIATEAHRETLHSADVVWLDAATTLAGIMRGGRVDRDAFFEVVGGVVRTAAASGRPVRAFGEMVALLWDGGEVAAAIELESLWNELATQLPFSLYCAYRSQSVMGSDHAQALASVCHLHSVVAREWRFDAGADAPGGARDALAGALGHHRHDGAFLDDVRLVVTELAANAVVHARSSFSVSLRDHGSTIRILVGDGSSEAPTIRAGSHTRSSGRGLRMIAAIATRWGVDLKHDGKVVWAELSAPGAPHAA
jgi:hypothetical protein